MSRPFDGVPSEILMEIFTQSCSGIYPICFSVAITTSQVCAHWRVIVLSMPNLWASFSLPATLVRGARDSWHKRAVLSLLHTHLDRSLDSPLTIEVNLPKNKPSSQTLAILAALVDHSERWASVRLPFAPPFIPSLSRLSGRLGQLESLDLRLKGLNDSEAYPDFFVTPRLRRLVLGSSVSCRLPFPKNRLTELHLGAAATLWIVPFMAHCPCPGLTRLTLTPLHDYYSTNISKRLPTFMHLHTLIFEIRDGFSRNPVIDTLELLTTPALTTLEIIGLRGIRLPHRTFKSFLERSGCMLKTLCISIKDELTCTELLSNLTELVSLTCFILDIREEPTSTTAGLILTSLVFNEKLPILPNLATFEVHIDVWDDTVLDVVESRFHGTGGQLRSLILKHVPDSEVAHAKLQSLKSTGLRVSYNCYTPSALFI